MSRQQHELPNAPRLPSIDEVVQGPKERLSTKACGASRVNRVGRVHTVLDGGGAQDLQFGGKVVGEPFNDHRVAPHREMSAVRLAGADRYENPGIRGEGVPDVVRVHFLEA
jgi:hypothetical protein